MKALHFHAVAPHPSVAQPLLGQADKVLRPFKRFLGQAIHTAKQRQVRYQLPWEPVRDIVVLALEPRDIWLRWLRPTPAWILRGWREDAPLALDQPLMVVSRNVMVRVLSASRTPQGVRIETESPLREGDVVFWQGERCALDPEGTVARPETLRTLEGRALRVLDGVHPDGETHWRCLVEGPLDARELDIDGRRVEITVPPPFEGVRRLADSSGRTFELRGEQLKVVELPAEGPLRADNGVRFDWRERTKRGRAGHWVQLLPPATLDADAFIDPRAAFCEDEVAEVWTQPRHSEATAYRVKRVDRDSYQLLLDRLPPEGTLLHLPLDLRNLHLQLRALRQLSEGPLPHHRPLLRLCEDPTKTRWPDAPPRWPTRWHFLTDETRSGTDEQRRFVARALGTPDFAFLEGPPGSGKTTAICELVRQLVSEGQRVLLCASTHVAIDNVLERLLAPGGDGAAIDAVRVGKLDRVDESVQSCQLDRKVENLLARWRDVGAFAGVGEAELRLMAERTAVMAANLTCGTTMGILGHPLFREREREGRPADRPVATAPHWDVLIVDEASKTLTQEFLVPALLARRQVIVGDVRQLPPFADRADMVANLRCLVNERDQEVFPPDHQRAALLLFRLGPRVVHGTGVRWLIAEPPGVLDWIGGELDEHDEVPFTLARVVSKGGRSGRHVTEVTVAEVRSGAPRALHLAAADFVLVGTDVLPQVSRHLPGDLVATRDLTTNDAGLAESDPWLFRHAHWGRANRPLDATYRERGVSVDTAQEAERHEQRWLKGKDHAGELAWRVTRLHELRWSRNAKERERLEREIQRLLPRAADIEGPVEEIQDIGLPGVLEVLQEGIGAERASRRSALTEGIPHAQRGAFEARFERLSFQHRMHPDIAAFPRELFYREQGALRDANTIAARDAAVGWDYAGFSARRVWLDVDGHEHNGQNDHEVRAMRAVLVDFARWARRKGPPSRGAGGRWEVACLSFYVKQERAVAQMLRDLTGDARSTRFAMDGVEVVCGTVDRFQGREADLVLLSMRNTGRVGFLDSPNRLNVAVTRARQQLIVIGRAEYYAGCRIGELEALARRTARVPARQWMGG